MIDTLTHTGVENGVTWLDANIPDWIDRIDVDTLDLQDCVKCVLGQLFDPTEPGAPQEYGGFTYASNRYFSRDFETLVFYGFEADTERHSYDELTEAWRSVILERRAMI